LWAGGNPHGFESSPVIPTAFFFGGDSNSDLDSLGLQLVKRVAEIVAHGVHEHGVVFRSFVIAARVAKLRRRACESGGAEGGETLQNPKRKLCTQKNFG
jgi:hypothetical protein